MAKSVGLFRNLETKVMALIMALVLYVYATSERSGQDNNVPIPLTVVLPAGTTTLDKAPPTHVRVSFSGPQKAIDKLREVRNQVEFRCVVDEKGNENKDEWTATVALDVTHLVNVPPEVSLTLVDPDKITLTLARTTSKDLKVRLQMTREPPPGLEVTKTEVWPTTVNITGPKKVLAHATEISTEPVDLSSLPYVERINYTVRVQQSVEVKIDNKTVSMPIECNREVMYWITMNQIKDTLTLKKLPVNILMQPTYAYVAALIPGQETVDVTVKGLKQSLSRLNPSNVIAYVDVNNQRPADVPAPVTVRFVLPDDVQGKVEVVNDPAKVVGVAISERTPKEKGTSAGGIRP